MQRSFEAEEFEPEEEKHDPVFTLGPVMLLAILCGLLLLCGLFFALGYSAGRRSSPTAGLTVTRTAEGQTLSATGASALSKPPAKGLVPATQPPQTAAQTDHPASLDGVPTGSALTTYAPSPANSNSAASQPQVRAALPSVQNGSQTTASATTSYQVQPALGPGSGVMVQIAAVSHIEDANVLMGALRKRGYAVVARRQPADDLIHVQIGPFARRSDADTMSRKLLSDGYNAVVLP